MRQKMKSLLIAIMSLYMFVIIRCNAANDAKPSEGNAGRASSAVHDDHSGHDHDGEGEGILHFSSDIVSRMAIKTVRVGHQTFENRINAPGKVVPDQNREAIIGSFISGRVQKIFANVGDRISGNDPLVKIESLEIGTIKAEYIEFRAEAENAAAAYQRLDTLFKQNVGSLKSLLDAKADLDKARARFIAADRRLHSIGITDEEAEDELRNHGHEGASLTIYAPIAGTVVERNIVVGQDVEAADNLMRIMDLSQVWVDAQVYEKDLALAKAGRKILFTVPAWNSVAFTGSVLFVGKMLDPRARTVTVRSIVHNPDDLLLPEMYGDVAILSGEGKKSLAVPEAAVLKQEAHTFVFVRVGESNEFKKRIVEPGQSGNGWTEITAGLEEGELVVSEGAFALYAESQKGSFESGHAH